MLYDIAMFKYRQRIRKVAYQHIQPQYELNFSFIKSLGFFCYLTFSGYTKLLSASEEIL